MSATQPSGHECDTGHFDRTICPEPCGTMHSYCSTCGARADDCAHDATQPSGDPMTVAGEHAADRLMRQQALERGSIYLRDDPPPTQQQVSAVLRALADHTLLMHLSSVEVQQMGEGRAHLGHGWQHATAVGRFLQRMGDWLDVGAGCRKCEAVRDEVDRLVAQREATAHQRGVEQAKAGIADAIRAGQSTVPLRLGVDPTEDCARIAEGWQPGEDGA